MNCDSLRTVALVGAAMVIGSVTPTLAQSTATRTRALEWNAEINAPVAQVWALFTTKEGIERWMTPLAEVDLRIGGTIRTNYNPNGTIGDEGTIVHRVLSFEPERMLSMRVEQSPAGFPHGRVIEQAWGVTYFEPLGPKRTKIRLVSAGWGEGPEWDAAEAFFEAGNEWTLDKLRALFPGDSADAGATLDHVNVTLELARRLIGGEWVAEQAAPDGGTFRVRNVSIDGPDGRSVFTRGWLGDASGMFEHGQGQVWIEPGANEVRFQNINEQGHVARGVITSPAPDTLVWDWHARSDAGPRQHYRVTMIFTGPDAYRFKLEHVEEGDTYRELIALPFTRAKHTSKAPAAAPNPLDR